MKRRILYILLFVCVFWPPAKAYTQNTLQSKAERLSIALNRHQFIFDAITATPQRGGSRTLQQDYFFLEIKEDSLICELPFFGRRYSVPAPEELIYGGYQFSTRSFTITGAPGNKDRYELQIATKPFKDELKISCSISKNGWGDVQIQSSGRDPISYYGRVSPLPEEK